MMNRPMMTCAEIDEALSDYFEETLDGPSRLRVDQHVSSCLRCGAILRDISAIRAEAAQLPELAPSHNLWEAIAARIEPAVVPLASRTLRDLPRKWVPRVAAAAALVIATAGITNFATSRSMRPDGSSATVASQPSQSPVRKTVVPVPAETSSAQVAAAPTAARSSAAPTTEARTEIRPPSRNVTLASHKVAAPASPGEIAYGDEIERLQNVITQRRRELDPATVTVIEQSLKIIDAAVRQSRAALARDPKSGFLADQLNNALDKKVELLRTVALLPSRT